MRPRRSDEYANAGGPPAGLPKLSGFITFAEGYISLEIRLPPKGDQTERRVLYFGPFALDEARWTLFRRGAPIHLTNKALRLLLLLVSHPNATLTVDEIMSRVWAGNEEATDATLRQHILMLRHALEDSATQRYIVTDHGRGYRFIGDVTERPPPYMGGIVEQYCAAAAEFRNSGSPAGTMAALHLYDRALTIDASNATALAGAALTRVLMADFQYDRPRELLEAAAIQSGAALLEDSKSVEGLMASCKVRLDYSWDFEGALAIVRRALEVDPKHRIAAFMYGWILALSSRFAEAMDFFDTLPSDVSGLNIIATGRAITSLFSGDYLAGKERLHAVCKRWPEYWFARTFLGLASLLLGEAGEAIDHFDQVRISVYHPLVDRQMNARYFAEGYALYARFRSGHVRDAEKDLERLQYLSASQFVPATCFALAEIGRHNHAAALQYIRQCGDNRECWYTHLRVEPLVKELGLDPAELYGP